MGILKYVLSIGAGLLSAVACYVAISKESEIRKVREMQRGMGIQPGMPQPQQPIDQQMMGQPMDPGMGNQPYPGPGSVDPMIQGQPCPPNLGMNSGNLMSNPPYPNGYDRLRQSNNLVNKLDKIQIALVNFARFISEIVRVVSLFVRATDYSYSVYPGMA